MRKYSVIIIGNDAVNPVSILPQIKQGLEQRMQEGFSPEAMNVRDFQRLELNVDGESVEVEFTRTE